MTICWGGAAVISFENGGFSLCRFLHMYVKNVSQHQKYLRTANEVDLKQVILMSLLCVGHMVWLFKSKKQKIFNHFQLQYHH